MYVAIFGCFSLFNCVHLVSSFHYGTIRMFFYLHFTNLHIASCVYQFCIVCFRLKMSHKHSDGGKTFCFYSFVDRLLVCVIEGSGNGAFCFYRVCVIYCISFRNDYVLVSLGSNVFLLQLVI